jgi:hypothetical protein
MNSKDMVGNSQGLFQGIILPCGGTEENHKKLSKEGQ